MSHICVSRLPIPLRVSANNSVIVSRHPSIRYSTAKRLSLFPKWADTLYGSREVALSGLAKVLDVLFSFYE